MAAVQSGTRPSNTARYFRRFRLLLVCAAVLPAPALAEVTAPKAAVAPATGASAPPAWVSAYARGQWSAAIELLETIPEPSRTAWHWLHLARAREKRAQLVESFAAYEHLFEVAADAPGAPGMKDVKTQAKAESAALTGRIPWAQVNVDGSVPLGGLVYVDQQWLDPERLRLPYPVNPGWHTFLVESNGRVLAARRVHFEEGQSRVVPLSLLESTRQNASVGRSGVDAPGVSSAVGVRDDDPWGIDSITTANMRRAPASKAVPAAASKATRSAASTVGEAQAQAQAQAGEPEARRSLAWHAAEQVADEPGERLLTSAYVSLGIGAASALIGTGFAIAAHNAKDTVALRSVNCFNTSCGSESYDVADSQWRRLAGIAGASYAVGIMGLVTGGILWLAHLEYDTPPKPRVRIADLEIEPGIRSDGAYLRGRF
jgi:hypothetical protein